MQLLTSRPGSGNPPWWRENGPDILLAVGLAAATMVAYLPLANLGLRFGDDGYVTYGAVRLLQGEMLYRDFERGYPPGMFWLYATVFRLLGIDLLYTRIAAIVLLAMLGVASFGLARLLAPRWAALTVGLLVVCVRPPLHKTFVPLAAVLGLAICARLAWRGYGRATVFWAGFGLGCLGLFRQEVAAFGFAIAAGTIAVVALTGAKDRLGGEASAGRLPQPVWWWLQLVVGAAVVWLPFLAYYAYHGALGGMLDQVVLAGYYANEGMQLSFPSPVAPRLWAGLGVESLWRQISHLLFYFPGVAAASGMLFAGLRLWRGSFGRREGVLLQWALLTVLLHSLFLHRSDLAHLKQSFAVPTLILAFALGSLGGRARGSGMHHRAWVGALVLACGWSLAVGAWGIRTHIVLAHEARTRGRLLDEPRARFVVPVEEHRAVSRTLERIRSLSRPGEPIFVAPYAPLIYLLADRPNPTRYGILSPGHFTREEVQREVVGVLEERKVDVLIVRKVPFGESRASVFPNYAPIMGRHLRTRFRRDSRAGVWAIHVRRRE